MTWPEYVQAMKKAIETGDVLKPPVVRYETADPKKVSLKVPKFLKLLRLTR